MAKSFIILLLYITSVFSDTEVKVEMAKEESVAEKTNEAPVEAESSIKQKRDSWPVHSTPCPPHWPHNDWHMPEHHHKVQFIHQPTVTIVKPHHSGWNHGWNSHDPWNKHGWSKPSYGWPMSGWQSPSHGWQSGWKAPSHGWQPHGLQGSHGWPSHGYPSHGSSSHGWPSHGYPSHGSPSHGWPSHGWQKPAYSYAPMYQHVPNYHHLKPAVIVKPDCPDEHHHHPHHHHTGVVYAPQHSYHHPEPHYVKIVKPVYHHPQPAYHHQPVYHHPVHHVPKVEICD